MGLLPEVARRRLYEKKGCVSIFEFASKYGGVSKEYVQRILCINDTFEERNVTKLTSLLQKGEVSVSKLSKITSIVTKENEDQIIHAIKNLPHSSLETYVRDMKIEMKLSENSDNFVNNAFVKNVRTNGIASHARQEQANLTFGDMVVAGCENGGVVESREDVGESSVESFGDDKAAVVGRSEAGAFEILKLELAPDIVEQLQYLKSCGIDINQFIRDLLAKRSVEIQQAKHAIAERVIAKETVKRESGREISRHVPIDVRKTLEREFGTKCAIPQCTHESDHLHHTARFSQSRSHNPYFMAPLCKEHHDIAHLVDVEFWRMKNCVKSEACLC